MKLIVAMMIVGAALAPYVEGETFTIGYLAPSAHNVMNHIQGPAINIAIEDFQANGWLREHDFK